MSSMPPGLTSCAVSSVTAPMTPIRDVALLDDRVRVDPVRDLVVPFAYTFAPTLGKSVFGLTRSRRSA